jgi:hypothetical protein
MHGIPPAHTSVIPAKAGIPSNCVQLERNGIPAFAGMTEQTYIGAFEVEVAFDVAFEVAFDVAFEVVVEVVVEVNPLLPSRRSG